MTNKSDPEKQEMSRVDELSLKLLDEEITDEEFDELEKLCEDDENFENHKLLIEMEATLRSERKLPEDFSEQIMQKIRELEKSRGKLKENFSDGEGNEN